MAAAIAAFSRRREGQERAPVILLERVERRENGTQDSHDDDKDTYGGCDFGIRDGAGFLIRGFLRPHDVELPPTDSGETPDQTRNVTTLISFLLRLQAWSPHYPCFVGNTSMLYGSTAPRPYPACGQWACSP